MGPGNLLRYAVSDLRHRWVATALNVTAVALAAVYIYSLGFYGIGIYRYQDALLAENQPTNITATTPEVTDRDRRFTEQRRAELAQLPGVRLVFPHVELNVRVALETGPAVELPAEGTIPGDPTLAPSRLAWGATVAGEDGREIVLSRALFERLGGVVGAQLSPTAVTLEVGRTVGGHEQVQRLRLRIAGLLQHQTTEKVYLPVQLAALLDLWCTNKVDNVPAERGRTRVAQVAYPFCYAYVLPSQVGRVPAEADNFNVTARPAGDVEIRDEMGKPRRLLRFEVRDPRNAEGRMSEELVAALRLSRPTFETTRPFLSVPGTLGPGEEEVVFVGSDAADPARFLAAPVAGTWLPAGAARHAVVLPDSVAAELAREKVLGNLVGRKVTVQFRRTLPDGRRAALSLPLEVAGVVEGKQAYVPLRLATDVALWQGGKLVFNDTRLEFEVPAETVLRAGYVRCTLIARDPESVAGVVRELQRQGYRTEDRLAEQEGLRRLGCVLVAVVGFFVFGCSLNAAITVLITTMMNIRSKTWEIGILRAHGVPSRDVVLLFTCQGLLIGMAAFLAAAVLVAVGEPLLRSLVCQAFAWKPGTVLTGSPFQFSLWWLSAIVLTVSVGFALAGVLVPAALACRLSPVEALRRRE
jgi:hypothetical protein